MIKTELPLWGAFPFAPRELVKAQQPVPVELGRIPLLVFNRKFEFIMPKFTFVSRKVGGVALEGLRLTLPGNEGFGFMMEDDGNAVLESQKTTELVLSPDPDPELSGAWVATIFTPETPSLTDRRLFNNGIEFYVQHAAKRIESQQHSSV